MADARRWRLLVASGLLILAAASLSEAAEPRRVLLLHSFEREFAPFDVFTGNFRTELTQQSSEAVYFYEVSLQPAGSENMQEGPIVNYILAMFASSPLDLVVPIGGPAVRFAQKHRPRLFPTTPMLMAAVDERHLQMSSLTASDTVVGVMNDAPLVVENILRVLPQTTNVFVVIGNSRLEKFWREELDRELQRFRDRLNLVWLNELSFTEVLERSATLPPNSAILYVLLSVDSKGVSYTEERALTELHAAANAPIFGLQGSQLGRGIVGGPLMSISDLSRNTASVAVRILNGESPEGIKTPMQAPGPEVFDWRELRRWDIGEDRLPPGSIVQFRELTAWERYKRHVIVGVSVCLVEALLIVGLMANLAKRRHAERLLRESRNRLGAIFRNAADGIITINDRGIIESTNVAAEKMFGYPAEEMIGQSINTLVPSAFDAEQKPDLASDEFAAPTKLIGPGREAIGLRKDGSAFPLDFAVSEAVLDHRRIFTGILRDITERKQVEQMQREFGKQLLHAQEAERARLARELHDDITQRLALLAMDADRFDAEQDPVEQNNAMRELRDSLIRLSEDVHSLAYRLHPMLLERLGLGASLKAEGERLSRKESISVDVKVAEIPGISQEAKLCLFRVTQEALRNVGRHSRAKAAEVSLRPLDGGVQLTVSDTGVGFDPGQESQRLSLGLASMRERVRLLEGRLDIRSAPGSGTTISIWIPLKAATLDQSGKHEVLSKTASMHN